MEEKLLFEVDITEAADSSPTEVAQALELLGRGALAEGRLEAWGERVFTDQRVRDALARLAVKPPAELTAMLEKALGKPEVPAARLHESLGRIFDVVSPSTPNSTPGATRKKPPEAPKSGGKEFSLDHHLNGKPAAMVDLFEQIDEFARGLGADVSRRIRKFYVGFFVGKRSFCTVEIQRQRVTVYLSLDPTKATPWNEGAMRDVRTIGHYGMGDTEYSLSTPAQLDEVKALMKRAYNEKR